MDFHTFCVSRAKVRDDISWGKKEFKGFLILFKPIFGHALTDTCIGLHTATAFGFAIESDFNRATLVIQDFPWNTRTLQLMGMHTKHGIKLKVTVLKSEQGSEIL